MEIVMHGMREAAGADPPRPDVEIDTVISDDPAARAQEADKWIAQRLREIDYDLTHPIAQLLADHLQMKGIGTLVNMKNSNKLLDACEKHVMCKLPPPPESWHGESQRLIVTAVRAATSRFITHSMRKWDPERSAKDTYFVNYCLFEFKRVYLEYHKEESQALLEHPVGNLVNMFETRAAEDSTEDLAISRQTIREAMKLIGSQEFAEFVLLSAKGLTRKQIAKSLGISLSSLDRHVLEYRRKLERGGWSIGERR